MNLLNNKDARQVCDAINAKGMTVVSGENGGHGKLVLLLERAGVRAKFHVIPSNLNGRVLANIVRDARRALREKGAVFTEAELEEVTPPPAAPPAKKSRYAVPRTPTRLNRQEKADFYALYRSGESLAACCEAFAFSTQAAGVLIGDGDRGKFDDLLPEEYRSTKPAPKPSPMAALAAQAPKLEPGPVFTLPEPQRPRVSPLDPRLPKFAAEHDLLQGHVAEFKRLADELGIRVRVEVEVDWS